MLGLRNAAERDRGDVQQRRRQHLAVTEAALIGGHLVLAGLRQRPAHRRRRIPDAALVDQRARAIRPDQRAGQPAVGGEAVVELDAELMLRERRIDVRRPRGVVDHPTRVDG